MATYNQIVCKGTAHIVTLSGRAYYKYIDGFALAGYYYLTTGWTGPIVVSPDRNVARYDPYHTDPAVFYVTINGTKWYYTSSAGWMGGNLSASAGSYTVKIGSFGTEADAARALVNMYYELCSKITASVNPSSSGSILISGTTDVGNGYYVKGTNAALTATASSGYVFMNWSLSGDSWTSTSNPVTVSVNGAKNYVANFRNDYQITLQYDNDLGSASYAWDGTSINLSATESSNGQFVGWYINSVQISSSLSTTYTPSQDTTIEARFEKIWDIDDNVDGNGAIQYTRGMDKNDVTISVIPDTHHHFTQYEVQFGTETQYYNETPLFIHLTSDIIITAYIVEDDKFHITASADFPNGSIYVSDNDVYSGTVVTLWARPFPDYNFIQWGDGTYDNPKSITVTQDVTIVAEYQRTLESNGIYQYRCFVKDQLDMEGSPKAFMVVDTFDVKRDTMTKATTSVTVMEMPTNINDGDVLVVYDPKGTLLYNGVINSISDRTIRCSQMPSFYKGKWIYNVSPQDYLEHEIAVLLQNYADGRMYGSSWVDPQVAQRLGGITIDYIGSTSVNLPTDLDDNNNPKYTQKDMEEFIYELYEKYNIIFDFEINISGPNYVHIKVPNYDPLKVGNNMYAIQDMSPVTTIEETNRLIIYGSDKSYRATYIATKNNIVKEPSSTANRFDITNTAIVFSDDPEADLVANNLPETMYNHKLTFKLIVKNFIYQFGDFKLGGQLDIYHNDDYYNSVLTGYEIKKSSNQNITEVSFTCGKVRDSLTNKLTLRRVL